MLPAVELGGLPKRSNLMVERAWTDALILAYKALDNGAGKLNGTIIYTVLDKNRVPIDGSTMTYTGVLLECKRPGYDSQSANVAMLQLTFGLNASLT
jgi:hypothetical protein